MDENKIKKSIFSDEPDFFKSTELSESGMLLKSFNHKYVKRTGSPGNYKYWYKNKKGQLIEGKRPMDKKNIEKQIKQDGNTLERNPKYPKEQLEKKYQKDSNMNESSDFERDSLTKELMSFGTKNFIKEYPKYKSLIADIGFSKKEISKLTDEGFKELYQTVKKYNEKIKDIRKIVHHSHTGKNRSSGFSF